MLDPGVGGPPVAGPSNPMDQAQEIDNGHQVRPTPLNRIPTDPNRRNNPPGGNRNTPPNQGEGSQQHPTMHNDANSHTGSKAKITFVTLNIKGRRSGNIDKWMHVPQIMRDRKLGVLAVQETHLTNELAEQFQALFGSTFSLHYSPDPRTRNARGIAIILNKTTINTDEVTATTVVPGRALSLSIPWQGDSRVNVLTVYAPNSPAEAREFWKAIDNKVNTNRTLKPDVLLGDFNIVEDAIDRIPSKTDDPQAVERLREFRVKHNLIDRWRKANQEEKGYTWIRDDGTQSRIDRIYVREDYFIDCTGWQIEPAPIPTDHDLVSAKISTPTTPLIGRGRWAVPTRALKNKEAKTEIQKLGTHLAKELQRMQMRTETKNPQTLLREFKTKARETARAIEKRQQPMFKMKIKNYQRPSEKSRTTQTSTTRKKRSRQRT